MKALLSVNLIASCIVLSGTDGTINFWLIALLINVAVSFLALFTEVEA